MLILKNRVWFFIYAKNIPNRYSGTPATSVGGCIDLWQICVIIYMQK